MTHNIKVNNSIECATKIEDLINSINKDCYLTIQEEEKEYTTPFTRKYSNEALEILKDTNVDVKPDRRTGAPFLEEIITRPSLEIYKLSNAYLFGGKIRKKGNGFHEHGQLCLREDYSIFSQSYGVMDGLKTLSTLLSPTENKDQYILKSGFDEPVKFFGNYFLIGNAHDHFGHFLIEGLSRLWALKYISKKTIEDIKFVVYENGLIPPARRILEYLGISGENIIFCPDFAQFENIYIPSIGIRTHWWCHDAMNFVYDAISKAATDEKPEAKYPDKIFLSRGDINTRKLVNGKEVEKQFCNQGYWIVKPESLPIGDQIRMCANASSIVGCTGSQMYLALFQKKGGENIVFTPWNFSLKDDAMISNIRQSKLTYILGSKIDSSGSWKISISDDYLKNL